MLLLYNILSCLILGRTHAKESLEMDLSSFALRLYEGEILIHVQVAAKVQEVDVRSKSNVMAFLSIAIQRDAPRGLIPSPKATLLSFYYRPFVISTTMALEDGGSGVARMTASKWQPRLSYIRFGLTGDPGRVVVFLSFSSISLSLSSSVFFLFFSLRFSPLFIPLLFHFSSQSCSLLLRIACVSTANGISVVRIFRFYLARPRELSHKSL